MLQLDLRNSKRIQRTMGLMYIKMLKITKILATKNYWICFKAKCRSMIMGMWGSKIRKKNLDRSIALASQFKGTEIVTAELKHK